VLVVVGVADHVNDDGAGEQQDLIFAIRDVHAVGVGEGKPAFGNFRNLPSAALKDRGVNVDTVRARLP